MTTKINKMKESDLSRILKPQLEVMGYCVHGEVSLFKRHRVIDLVAHTGPCATPENVVTFELKTSLNQTLVDQLLKNDKGHYQCGHFAVVPCKKHNQELFSFLQDATQWYHCPGLIEVDLANNKFQVLFDTRLGSKNQKYTLKGLPRLLLTQENKDMQGGVALKKGEKLPTHWSTLRAQLQKVKTDNPLWTLDHYKAYFTEVNFPLIAMYKRKDLLLKRLMNSLTNQAPSRNYAKRRARKKG